MGAEIERKFVLAAEPEWLGSAPAEEIEQGYLATSADAEVRLRLIGGRPKLTVKAGSGLVRAEQEIDLSREQFDALWPLTAGRRVSKVRHRGTIAGRIVEVDVYREAHAGLIVAEVEFATLTEGERFEPPPWLGTEVTGDERWANRSLALAGRVPEAPRDL